MRLTLRAVALPLLCLAAWPTQAGTRADHAIPPRVIAFSPAAAHPGDAFLVDAEFDGDRRPRVWVGGRRVPRRNVRIADDADTGADGTRRVWARVPKRARAGEQEVRIATRAGAAVAAKPMTVASCEEEPVEPAQCGDIPNSGADLVVTGAGGFRRVLRSSASVVPQVFAGQTVVEIDGTQHSSFSFNVPQEPGAITQGAAEVLYQSFHSMEDPYGFWQVIGGTVTVAETSPTRVGFCIDVVIDSGSNGFEPGEVRVRGHVVIVR